ncbi:MAG: hypothetical protein FH761_18100 [Firmicutes bacterium]|nr:hypothetical protein [Bacillota bacterium]
MVKNKKRNITIRILAVFIATILWVYVMGEVNPRITKEFANIKVALKNEDYITQSNLYIMEPNEVQISVKVNGRRNDVLNITEKDIKAYVDLIGATDGMQRFPIDISPLDNMEIESYTPKEAKFKIDEIISKKIPVSIQKSGSVAEGYHTGNAIVKPESVLIKGPRTWVNSVSKVVATVDVADANEDLIVNVPYNVLDDKGKEVNLVEKEPSNVEITVPILRGKNLSIEPQIEGSPFRGYEITGIKTSPNTIEVMGSEEAIQNASALLTNPIDVSYLTSDYSTEVELIIPEGLRTVNSQTVANVEITVEPIVEKTFEYTIGDLTFLKIAEGLEVNEDSVENKVSITVSGIESIINSIEKRDITLYVDLDGLTEGEHKVEVKGLIDEEVEIINISPKTINMTLEKINEDAEEVDNQNPNDNENDSDQATNTSQSND